MSTSYFRNFRSSPAEQRESESELDKGEKETAEHSANLLNFSQHSGWRWWRSCKLTNMRGRDLKPSRCVNTSDMAALCFVLYQLTYFGSRHQSLNSNWIPFSTLTICCSGLACQCQGGGLEDGQGWSPVHRAGGRGAYQCAMFCMYEDKEPVPWKAVISKVDRRFISGYLCMVWLRSWRLAIWRPGVYK